MNQTGVVSAPIMRKPIEEGWARGMKRRVGKVFWIETSLASFTAFIAVLTIVWQDWIEGIFGFDPDRHDGAFEWELVGLCLLLTIVFVTLARREWRRAPVASPSGG